MTIRKSWNIISIIHLLFVLAINTAYSTLQAQQPSNASTSETEVRIIDAKKINTTTVVILLSNDQKIMVDFYEESIFRLFRDNSGKGMRLPEAKPEAQILVENPRRGISELNLTDSGKEFSISTGKINVIFNKESSLFKIFNLQTKGLVLEETELPVFEKEWVTLTLRENPNEYFYGGGVQNGRFSHKGKVISIENLDTYIDGGVASPTPFYWSSKGYGFMWHTFKKGSYDFGSRKNGQVKLVHNTDYLDVFFMVDETAGGLLNDLHQLTGSPVLLPKFGFYEGHLNAYNRDYWKEGVKGILFEDGNRYKESQQDNGGIRESLNGENNNYQFSARAVLDRYKSNDMPLGWILPNDGYGAGYGQTGTLDANIQNLTEFGDYARKNGVEIGLWTQSDLHPIDSVSALLQRDIVREVRDAGVRVLKTDVAWVGAGYSFGLNGVADVANIMPKYGDDARPFIITIDGWAGTQRYASVWTGDQTGGNWEYIRFHIPTYIGTGLSGQPNITSDVDGIFGGKDPIINTRDFQWKTFTPMQLNMDGWGANPKYPQALGEPTASINRNYLKLKSELIPYTYSIARTAVDSLPMVRAMFLESKNPYTQGKATQYQFMYGPYFLVAPIYRATESDADGNDIRNGIYLPEGTWIDYFNGEQYEGNRIINDFESPIWKLPVFVKKGAIIPMANPNNNMSEIKRDLRIFEIYPGGKSSFTAYDDDGMSEAYKLGKGATTLIESEVDKRNTAFITVHRTKGDFNGFEREKATEFRINVTERPEKVVVRVGDKKIKLVEAVSRAEFENEENVYFYNTDPNLNRFSTKGSEFEKVRIEKNPQILVKVNKADITANKVSIEVKGFRFAPADNDRITTGPLTFPQNAQLSEKNADAYSLVPTWDKVTNADFYEVEFSDMLYSTIKDTKLLFEDLTPETTYDFQVRAVNKSGNSLWSSFKAKTKDNPLEFAIKDISAKLTVADQEGEGITKLFDFDEASMWHTNWNIRAVPFDMVIDLNSINQLDKMEYAPTSNRGSGILLQGTVFYSLDKQDWTEAGTFTWAKNDELKSFDFEANPKGRYIKISVSEPVGGAGSGRELYVYKVPGSKSYLQGDINSDGAIDGNDLTSFTNYVGLRKGDPGFEGYVSNGDVNNNGLIDAYDISVVATQLDGGVNENNAEKVAGSIELGTSKKSYNKGDIIDVTVKGINLKSVNALSFALPYNASVYEFLGMENLNVEGMENLTQDRLHSNREKVLYPTFVNMGEQTPLEGTSDLFVIKFKVKQNTTFNLKSFNGLLVDKDLNTIKF